MLITPRDYTTLHEACAALDANGIPYVIGGGTAVELYGRNRRTKDFDIFLHRGLLKATMDVLSRGGFTTAETEKNWLYKAWRDELIIDLVVESRGGTSVDDETIRQARIFTLHGYDFRIMGPEDTLFRKALTLTEGRPDWYDGISIIDRQRETLDWTYFLYLAQRNPRRILSFLLFTQTELHVPPQPRLAATDNMVYQGDAPGPVPQWVVFTLVEQVWLRGAASPRNPHRLTYLPRAA